MAMLGGNETGQAHAHRHAGVAERPDTAPDMGADSTGHAGHGMLKCCSAGCSMVALSAPELPTARPAGSDAPLAAPVPLYSGVVLDGLDRPPRLLRA